MKRIIHTEKAPAAIGPYSQAVEANGMLFVSGQIPVDPETGIIPEGIKAQTEQVMKNLAAILLEAGYSFDDVVKTTCLLSDIANFGAERGLCTIFHCQPSGTRSLCSPRPA